MLSADLRQIRDDAWLLKGKTGPQLSPDTENSEAEEVGSGGDPELRAGKKLKGYASFVLSISFKLNVGSVVLQHSGN